MNRAARHTSSTARAENGKSFQDNHTGQIAPASRFLSAAALVILVSLACGRVLINETTVQRGPLMEAGAYGSLPVEQQVYMPVRVVRIMSILVISLAALAWSVATLISGRLKLIKPGLLTAIIFCCVWLVFSISGASDKREAIVAAIEQISLLGCLALTMQLVDRPWRRRLVLVALCAMTSVLGAKAMYQVMVEIPEHNAFFNEHRAEQLGSLGIEDGTPDAVMIEARIVEKTAKGFFSLANLFGSLMAMLSAIVLGLGIDRLQIWRRELRDKTLKREKGEIPVSLATGGLCLIIAALGTVACMATQSKGAIAVCIFGLILGCVIYSARKIITKRRRVFIVAGSAICLAAIAAVICLGIVRGSLPSRSMQVRWEYWLGSAQLAIENPLTGVGPGGFADAYLAVRPAGAEEAVKNPHNVIAHVFAEYGLPGGAAYILVLAWTLIAICQRRCQQQPKHSPDDRRAAWIASAMIVAAAILYKALTNYYPTAAAYIVENFIAILMLPTGALVGLWATSPNDLDKNNDARAATVIFTTCGLGAFALHNLTDFALFKPATAMVFWLGCGAILADTQSKSITLKRPAAAFISLIILAGSSWTFTAVYLPVRSAERAAYDAAKAISASRRAKTPAESARLIGQGITKMQQAGKADRLDSLYPADLASLSSQLLQSGAKNSQQANLQNIALDAAKEALERDSRSVQNREMLLRINVMAIMPDLYLLPSTTLNAGGSVGVGFANNSNAIQSQQQVNLSAEELNSTARDKWLEGQNFEKADTTGAIELLQYAVVKYADSRPALLSNLGDAFYLNSNREQAEKFWRKYLEKMTESELPTSATPLATPATPTTDKKHLKDMIIDLARRDPYDSYKRLWLAELAWRLGDTKLSVANAAAAEKADAALFHSSVLKFDDKVLKLLEMVTTRAHIQIRQ